LRAGGAHGAARALARVPRAPAPIGGMRSHGSYIFDSFSRRIFKGCKAF